MADDHLSVYEALLDAHKNGVPAVLATVTETQGSMPRHEGTKMLIYADGSIVGTVGGGAMESDVIATALEALTTHQPLTKTYRLNNLDEGDPGICGGSASIFIEPLVSLPTLLVIGGGHVGKATAELGKWLGFRVILSDDRPEFCNADYIPDLNAYVVCKPNQITEQITINNHTYITAVTRGLPVDVDLFPALLATDAPYIGLIGSRRRWAVTLDALKTEHNLTNEQLSRVHAPIGLELEAETPKEIAISILAEIIMIRRGGTGQPMQWMDKTLNT
jgi:xanthine dehydrogenase accessory factor